MYLNKVMLIGNLTRDPELKSLPSVVKVVSFSMATNRTWKTEQGEKKEDDDSSEKDENDIYSRKNSQNKKAA